MKKFFTFILFLSLAITASAVPAKRGHFTVQNPDGTTLTLSLRGDETFHYYVNSEGTPMRQNAQGVWETDSRDVTSLHRAALSRRNASRQQMATHMRKAMRAVRAPYRADERTSKRGLLILVNFSDKKMARSDEATKTIFNQMLNAIGNPYGKNYGSIREYFRAQSYNQFDVEFDVAGPVTLPKTMEYYGKDEGGEEGNDAHPGEMVVEACKRVDDEVDFSKYDWDGDKEVENVYIVYAGYAQASGAPSNTIWPHQWNLSDADNYGRSLKLDGVTIDTYACGSELYGISGNVLDGIGTMCHEYSHCLGLPDFYDTAGSNFGMDSWSVLDYGCYSGDGFCPAGYTAYERWYSGWLTPVELTEPVSVKDMQCIENNPEAYIIYNDKNRNEYYMLANHQQVSWDSEAYGHGLMILHVDYNKRAWEDNTINNDSRHQRMTLIPADNKLSHQNLGGDLWPSSKNKTELTDTSTPAASLFNANTDGKKFMHKPITDITEKNELISFAFMGGNDEPSILPPSEAEVLEVSPTGFTAQWNAVEGAVSYNLSLTEIYDDGQPGNPDVGDAVCIYEDCHNFYVDGGNSDATTDLKDQLDDYTVYKGWTGEKVYKGLYGAKIGSNSSKGWLSTPALTSTTSKATVYLYAIDWFNNAKYIESGTYNPDGSTIDIVVMDEAGNELQRQNVKAPDYMELSEGEYPEFTVSFTDVPSSFKIKVSTTSPRKRIYMSYVIVLDGDFTLDEIYTLFDEEEVKARMPRRVQVKTTTTLINITTNSYVFSSLKPSAQYTYRVQAVDAEGKMSAWSEEVSVTLPDNPDALRTITASEDASATTLYDLSGRKVINTPSIGEGRGGLSRTLPKGIYILNGHKILIR